MPLVQHIISTSPVTFDDNYQTRLRKRVELLNRRLDIINAYSHAGSIEYDSNGMACKFYPNVFARKYKTRCDKMRKQIFKEMNEIAKII